MPSMRSPAASVGSASSAKQTRIAKIRDMHAPGGIDVLQDAWRRRRVARKTKPACAGFVQGRTETLLGSACAARQLAAELIPLFERDAVIAVAVHVGEAQRVVGGAGKFFLGDFV